MVSAKHDYDMTVYPIQAAVRSEHDGARVYTVTLPHCPCADFTNRKGQLIEIEVGGVAVSICKHIATALMRVGGWHRGERVLTDLTHAVAKALLQGPDVQLTNRAANSVLHEAGDSYAGSEFTTEDGALCNGTVTYDKVQSCYTVTIK